MAIDEKFRKQADKQNGEMNKPEKSNSLLAVINKGGAQRNTAKIDKAVKEIQKLRKEQKDCTYTTSVPSRRNSKTKETFRTSFECTKWLKLEWEIHALAREALEKNVNFSEFLREAIAEKIERDSSTPEMSQFYRTDIGKETGDGDKS